MSTTFTQCVAFFIHFVGITSVNWNIVNGPLEYFSKKNQNKNRFFWNPWMLIGHSCGALLQANSNMKYQYDSDRKVWMLQHGIKRKQSLFTVEQILGTSPFLLCCQLKDVNNDREDMATSSTSSSSSSASMSRTLVLDERPPAQSLYTITDEGSVPIDAVNVYNFSSASSNQVVLTCALRCGVVVLMHKKKEEGDDKSDSNDDLISM